MVNNTVRTMNFFSSGIMEFIGKQCKRARFFSWVDYRKTTDIVAGHPQRGSAIRWREDIEMDVAKISGGASNLAGYT